MENKKIICNKSEKSAILSRHLIFKWNVDSEKDLNDGKYEILLSRDDTKSYHTELVNLEKNFTPKLIPLFAAIIPVLLSIILITIFLIMFILKVNNNEDIVTRLIAFFIPAGALMMLSVALFYLRTKKLENFIKNKDILEKEAQNKVEELLKKYGE